MAKNKSGKFKFIKLCFLTLLLFCVLIMVMIAGIASSSGAEGGRQESVTAVQTSALESYTASTTHQQNTLVQMAINENQSRKGTSTKGADTYIKNLTPNDYKAAKKKDRNNPVNVEWSSYFVGQCMKNAGISTDSWSKSVSAFATKLNNQRKFHIADGYIPKVGDIVFFGKALKVLSANDTIRADHCGIVSRVNIVNNRTEINAIQITVIEGDVEGSIISGKYSHSTSYVKEYTYDLYSFTGNSHYTMTSSKGAITGYGTVADDVNSVEFTSDSSDTEHLYYTINIRYRYEDALSKRNRSE